MHPLLLLILFICVACICYVVVLRRAIPMFLGGARGRSAAPSKSESRVIAIAEKLTGCAFPCVHPSWLRDGGAPLELDGYCKELGVAIEFQGPLHTKWYSAREPYEKYIARVERDDAKKRICADRGVKLITIDVEVLKMTPASIEKYIYSRLKDVGAPTRKTLEYIPEISVVPYRMVV